MLRLFLLFYLSLILVSAHAQILPNQSLENWSNNGEFLNPDGWDCSNRSFFSILSFTTTTRETGAFDGSYCSKLQTIEESTGGETVKMAGIMTLGIFDVNIIERTAIVKGGIPFTQKPTYLTGYYKYYPNGTDSCNIMIALTKYNNVVGKTDTLGYGKFASSTTTEWTRFVLPVEYYTEEQPDSMNIVFISSDTSIFNVGSTLYIDSLNLEGVNSISEVYSNKGISIFPNPTKDFIYVEFEISPNEKLQYSIINNKGQTEKQGYLEYKKSEISLKNIDKGHYFLKIFKGSETTICKKIIIER